MGKRLLPLGLILLLAAILTPLTQEYTRETIVMPLLYFYWVGRLIFESIPQIIFWSIFLIIILLMAVNSLWQTKPRLRQVRHPGTPEPERIRAWATLLRKADQEDYYRWQLAQRLNKLVVAALSHDERVEASEIRQRLAAKQLDLPADIQAYLEAGMTSFGHFLGPRYRYSWRRRHTTPLNLDPERVIQFLEDNLDYYTE